MTALLCVATWKRFTLILATIWHKSFWLNTCALENRNLWVLFQSAIRHKTRHCPNQFFFYFFNLCFLFLSHGVSLVQWSRLRQSRHKQTRLLQFQSTRLVCLFVCFFNCLALVLFFSALILVFFGNSFNFFSAVNWIF